MPVVFDVWISVREVEPFSLSLLRKVIIFIEFSVLKSEPFRLGSSSEEELEDGNDGFSPARIHGRMKVVWNSILAETALSITTARNLIMDELFGVFLSFIELGGKTSGPSRRFGRTGGIW